MKWFFSHFRRHSPDYLSYFPRRAREHDFPPTWAEASVSRSKYTWNIQSGEQSLYEITRPRPHEPETYRRVYFDPRTNVSFHFLHVYILFVGNVPKLESPYKVGLFAASFAVM